MTVQQKEKTVGLDDDEQRRKSELIQALITKVCETGEVPEINFPIEFYGNMKPLMSKLIERRGEVPSVKFMEEMYKFEPTKKDADLTLQDTIDLLSKIFMKEYTRKTMVEYLQQTKNDSGGDSPVKIIDEIVQKLGAISTVMQSNAAIDVISEADRIASIYEKRINNKTPIKTGFRLFDEEVAPEGGQLMLFCAPMKRGKTTAMTFMFATAIKNDIPALFVSLEMNEVEMTNKLLSTMGYAKYSDLRKGKVAPSRYKEMCQALGKNRAIILTPSGIRGAIGIRTIEKYVQEHRPKVVFVDYLALLAGVDMNWNASVQPTAEFKRIAQQYDCYIVVALQADPNLLKGGEESGLDGILENDSDLPIPGPYNVRANKNLGADCDHFIGANSRKMQTDSNQMEFHMSVELNRHGHTPAFKYIVNLDKGEWKEVRMKQ